jgi:DNA-binding NarL/FixJ family response regulator
MSWCGAGSGACSSGTATSPWWASRATAPGRSNWSAGTARGCCCWTSLVATLTDREREVLDWLSRGLGDLQIARSLYLSEGAIKAHVSNLLRKLSCENRVQAAILAHDARLATPA